MRRFSRRFAPESTSSENRSGVVRVDSIKEEPRMDTNGMDRRQFIKVSGAGAAAAATGIEGVLAARRAPAYAQGTKLHIVRWVDFIPQAEGLMFLTLRNVLSDAKRPVRF